MADFGDESTNQLAVENVAKSCHRLEGTFEDHVNWVESGHVTPNVGSQGNCSVCWAWCAAKGVEAAFACAGRTVPPLSVQYVVDHTYPKRPGCRGGAVAAALDLMTEVGIAEESKYYEYTGIKKGNVKAPPEEELFKIDGWCLIKDNEEEMVAALEIQPLIVNIAYASGVFLFDGEGLLDLVAAEKYNIPALVPDHVVSHSVLLVGHGTFYSSTSCRGVRRIGYWKIKNQWEEKWGTKGFAYLIKNSSLIEMKEIEIGRTLTTRKEREDATWDYIPIVPVVGRVPPPVHVPYFTIEEMVDFIKSPDHLHRDLLFFLYVDDDGYGKESAIKAFNSICRLFEYEEDKVVGSHIITSDTKKMFSLNRRDTIVFLSYKAKDDGRNKKKRDLKDRIRYNGKSFNFADLLDWVGNDLSMGRGSV